MAATGSTRESTAPPAATTTTMTTTTTSTHPPPPSTTWVQSSLQRVLGRGIQNKIVLHNQHKVTLRVCYDQHNHAEDVSVSLLPGAKSPHPWHCQCGIHGHNFRVTFVTNITPFRRGGFYTYHSRKSRTKPVHFRLEKVWSVDTSDNFRKSGVHFCSQASSIVFKWVGFISSYQN